MASASKDNEGSGGSVAGGMLNPGFPFATPTIPGTNVPMFPPMMDMSSTQALLSMVRSSQFDAFMSNKTGGGGGSGATKRPSSSSSSSSNPHGSGTVAAAAASEQNPLDLSASSIPCKKSRKGGLVASHWESAAAAAAAAGTFAETFLHMPAFGLAALQKSREKLVMTNGGNKRLGSVSPKPATKTSAKQPACQATPNRALPCTSSCSSSATAADKHTCPNATEKSTVAAWTVNDVCDFVGTIDLCAEYSQVSKNNFFFLYTN